MGYIKNRLRKWLLDEEQTNETDAKDVEAAEGSEHLLTAGESDVSPQAAEDADALQEEVAEVPAEPDAVHVHEKQMATAKGEPWVRVVNVSLDSDNIGNGSFELDWNDIFLAKLIRAGYKGKTDNDIVDQWFTDVCRNVLNENFEQWEANFPDESPRRQVPGGINRRDLGDGKSEFS